MSESMEKLVTEVKQQAEQADTETRLKLLDDLRKLAYSIEHPQDTLQRVHQYSLRSAILRTAVDLGLFKILTSSSSPVTLDQMVKTTGAASLLLGQYKDWL